MKLDIVVEAGNLLTMNEAAHYLSVHYQTLSRWRLAGTISAVMLKLAKLKHQYFFNINELNRIKELRASQKLNLKAKRRPAKWNKRWSEEDLEYLAHNYGLVSDKTMATRLQRTEGAIITAARKKYSISHIDNYNYYTAATLAEALGINESSIHLWIKKGWLKGKRPPNINGKRGAWRLTERRIIKCLRQHPWLVLLKPTSQWLISDYSHHFFYIVREEWKKDPWYTVEQAAPLLGLSKKSKCGVFRYINMGWLRAEKKPCLGSSGGVWIIRRSAIQAFLKNDPRPQHKYVAERDRNHRFLMSLGYPYRLATIWVLKCPSCGQEVRIVASSQLNGAEVREKFITVYVNGACFHGAEVELTIPPTSAYVKGASGLSSIISSPTGRKGTDWKTLPAQPNAALALLPYSFPHGNKQITTA